MWTHQVQNTRHVAPFLWQKLNASRCGTFHIFGCGESFGNRYRRFGAVSTTWIFRGLSQCSSITSGNIVLLFAFVRWWGLRPPCLPLLRFGHFRAFTCPTTRRSGCIAVAVIACDGWSGASTAFTTLAVGRSGTGRRSAIFGVCCLILLRTAASVVLHFGEFLDCCRLLSYVSMFSCCSIYSIRECTALGLL